MTNGSTVQPERRKTAMIPAWDHAQWLVVDLETTGLSSHDAIIEIGAAVYENRELVDSFSALINPGSPLPSFITALTGLNDETLAHAPDLHTVFSHFCRWAEHLCDQRQISGLIAHNVAFDWGFLEQAQRACGIPLPHFQPIDTLSMARALLPIEVPNHKLTTLREHFKLGGGQHRALDDALATGMLFYKLCECAESLGKDPLAYCSPAYPLSS
ncbi:3'-5' exonuclease [uncultured Actinomyces sp.]|uniref:3'-5' exonuclease n=1 Tax=uncultured Actinomyces sp. TaxID=249061 RepID=UPI0028D8A009|nr:3'-5' exonuclease [uncultured Actinomyces sp.]